MFRLSQKDISIYLLALAMIVINIPALSRIVGGAVILALLLAAAFFNNRKYRSMHITYWHATFFAIAYIVLEVTYELLGISHCEYVYYYFTICFFFIACIAMPIIEDSSRRQQNILLFSVFASLFCTIVLNFILRVQYGSRYVRLGDTVKGTNAISTQYFSAIVLIAGILLTVLLFSRKHKVIVSGMLAVIIIFEVYVGQRMIAVLFLLAMMAAQILFYRKKSRAGYVILILLMLVAILVLFNLESILLWVSSMLKDTRIGARVDQILRMVQNSDIKGSGGSLEARFVLMSNSLRTFFSSPKAFLFGVGEDRASNLLVGHHSQWLDQLAKYGILGTVLLITALRKCFSALRHLIRKDTDHYLRVQLLIFEMYFLLRGMFGYVLYPYFAIALFVVIPIILTRINKESMGFGGKR